MNTTSDTANTAPLIPMADPNPQPYEAVRFNALKHGILSRYTVLSHESHADYESLVNSLMDEHLPAGATEQHLIEELASVIWRKRRVLQAEGATINKGLKESARSAKTVIPAAAPFEMGLSGENTDIRNLMDLKPADVAESHQSAKHDIDATNKASAILRKGGDRAYDKALRALLPDTREWWQNYVDDEEYPADATGLAAFITDHVTPFVYQQEKDALDLGKGWMDNEHGGANTHREERIAHAIKVMESMEDWQLDQAVKIVVTIAQPQKREGNGNED